MKLLSTLLTACALATSGLAQDLYFHSIATGFNSPIGIDHDEPSNSVVVSVNYSGGTPVALERILQNGSHVAFSTLSGVTDEVKIATVRSGAVNMGGFTAGELFVGNGVDGEIVRIGPGGLPITNPWASLPGAGNGLMRGSLYHDRTGVFGGDLIVCTTLGQVWRVNSLGLTGALPLASIGTHLEGLCTLPNDAAKYGPLAGKIVCGAEQQGLLYAIDVFGVVTSYDFGIDIEDIDLIPKGQNFYGVNFGTSKVLGVAASAFDAFAGDLLLTQELPSGSGLYRLHWNNGTSAFEVTQFGIKSGSAPVGQWEHVTFSHAGIDPLPAVYSGVNKDLMNATGSTADEVVISVQGVYGAGDIKSHFDGGFPTFAFSSTNGATQFSWSGMSVANNAVVHVGVELFGPAIKFASIAWRANGVTIGCARQVNSLYGTHTSGAHQVEYLNDVLGCASPTLHVGDLSLEYYFDQPPFAELNPNGVRNPFFVEQVNASPAAIAPGGSFVQVVSNPPAGAQFVVMVFKVSTSSALAPPDVTADFVVQPIEPPTPPSATTSYCTAGVSSNGCMATLSANGAVPSIAAGPGSFVITASNVEGQKAGLIFFGIHGRSNLAWGAGSSSFLCVKSPTQRTPPSISGGTANNCDGSLSLDFFGYMAAHPSALGNPLSAGTVFDAQCWYRDPASAKTTNLSDGLEFQIAP